MGAFKSAVITKKGQALMAKVVQGGTKLDFTQIKTSEKALSGDLASLTSIDTIKQAEKVASVVRQNLYNVKVSASFSNKGLTAGYYVRNIGLYAMDPTEGEILFSISVADESTATADWMPPYTGVSVSSLMVDLITAVSNASSVNVVVDPTATATVAQIMEVHERLTALDNSITTTTEKTLRGSVAGGLKIYKVLGKSTQGAEPTPDVPQEIKSVEISKIITCGKNLLKNYEERNTINGVTFTVNGDGSITANGTATDRVNYTLATNSNLLVRNGTYILSGCTGGSFDTYRLQWWTKATSFYCYDGDTVCNFAEEGDSYNITISIMSGVKVSNLTFYPMLRDASIVNNTYEPYMENSIILSQTITLNGIGEVRDRIVENGGVYGIEKQVASVVLDGSSNLWQSAGTGMGQNLFFQYPISDLKREKSLCSHFNHSSDIYTSTTNVGHSTTCVDKYVRFRPIDYATITIEEWKARLTESPITLYYQLDTPVFTPLPVVDQVALLSLAGYDGVTCLGTNSAVDPVIEVDYGTNKLGAHTLAGLLTAQRNEIKLEDLISHVNQA